MPLNSRATTSLPDDTRLDKSNARTFTVQVANQAVYYQVNVPPFGRGEQWSPSPGAILYPGIWNFTDSDWYEYGVTVAQGIRFYSVTPGNPAVITAS